MRIARNLLIAAALLPWPWIAGAPQAGAAPPVSLGVRSAAGPLILAADRDHDQDHDRDRGRHHRHRHRHHHQGDEGQHDHGD